MISGSRKINRCIISVKRLISNLPYLKWDRGSRQAMTVKIQSDGHILASCGFLIVVEISRNYRITCWAAYRRPNAPDEERAP